MLLQRAPKTRDEIERLVLLELRSNEACAGAAAVHVVPWEETGSRSNWTVAYYELGTARERHCGAALDRIVPRFQLFYELVQKH